ncbi:MAG: hypothetical protein WC511_03385 [Candidatus Pacearchaeota archaeon]
MKKAIRWKQNFIKELPKEIGEHIPVVKSGIKALEKTNQQIEETKRDKRLAEMDANIKKIIRGISNSISRDEKEIINELEKFEDKIWFDRHQLVKEGMNSGKIKTKPKIWRDALKAEKKMIKKYGKKELGPLDDFEWGMLNGKLSTLRWLLGEEWDMLDT